MIEPVFVHFVLFVHGCTRERKEKDGRKEEWMPEEEERKGEGRKGG